MKFTTTEHQSALQVIGAKEKGELEKALLSCAVDIRVRAAPEIREHLVTELGRAGWPGEIAVEPPSRITIASLKNGVGLCIQTGGNMARMYADILKLQKLYQEDRVRVGVMILPNSQAARKLGQNIANALRLEAELKIFRKVIHMPILIYAFG